MARTLLVGPGGTMTGRATKAMLAVATVALALVGQIPSAPRAGASTTRTVTNLNDSGSGSLRATIAAAASGDVIIFGVVGTVQLTTGQLTIGKDLTIIAPAGGVTISGENASRVFNITGGNVSLTRLNIDNGRASGDSLDAHSGGAISNQGALTVNDCSFTDNTAFSTANSDFVSSRGGAIYSTGPSLTVNGSTFDTNMAIGQTNVQGGLGGAIYQFGGPTVVNNSTFSSNSATTTNPQGSARGGLAGAIFGGSVLTVTGSTFNGNSSTINSGAIIGAGGSKVTITNTTFTGNTTGGDGGAIFDTGTITLTNSTLTGNTGKTGGGLDSSGATLRNTIIAGNTATAGSASGPDVRFAVTSLGHNLIGVTDGSSGWVASDLTGTSGSPLNAQLGSLQNNGGPTQTIAPASSSPAVNAGDDAVLSSPYSLTTDQRGPGFPRKVGTHVDIGAYELDAAQAGPTFTVTTLEDHDDNVCGTVDCTLREALGAANAAAGANTVKFAGGVTGTIHLSLGQLLLTDATTITGPGASKLAIDGDGVTQILFVNAPGLAVSISGLTIQHGLVVMPPGAGAGLGGALANNAVLSMSNCAVDDNHVQGAASMSSPDPGSPGQGGGIYNTGTLTMTACTVSRNSAAGGAGLNQTGPSTFATPGGAGQGGGIFNTGTLTLNNTTVSTNTAAGGNGGVGTPPGPAGSAQGGGVYNSGTFTSNSSTVADNITPLPGGSSLPVAGGGLFQGSTGGSTLHNTLVATNSSANGPDLSGHFTSTGYNLVGKGDASSSGLSNGVNHDQVGSVATPLNPKLGALKDNGGPTLTQALLAGSPAIDQGTTGLTTDQRGLTRPFDDPAVANASGGNGADIGAVERHQPTLSVNDVSVSEGDSGSVTATFTVSLYDAGTQTATVQYQTNDGTATAPADYTARALTSLSLTASTPTRTVSVTVKGDVLDEDNETFFVDLSSPTNAVLGKSRGVATILDDDELPAVAVNDVTVSEGDTGSLNAGFTVSLSSPSGRAVKVRYTTANGTAVAPGDYTAVPATTLTIPAGATSVTANVPYNGDLLSEATENFFVNLSVPTNATIGDGQGVGTILDNDPLPTVAVNDVTVTEGTGGTATANFTVSLNTPSGQAVTVQYATANGTATAPADYTAKALTTLTVSAGQTSKTVSVTIVTDATDEPDETFFLNLSAPTNGVIADSQGVATITDDDPVPTVSVNDVRVTEGNTTAVNANFTLTLSHASGRPVTVQYSTANGTATAPADYSALAPAAITFNPGEVTKTVTVPTQGDVLDEADETLFLNLSTPTNATIGDGQGVATIVDNDATPILSINNVSAAEGNSGTTNFDFTVKLSAASGRTVTVTYATADGTAIAPGDYTALPATVLTFNPGEAAKTVSVAVNGDATVEPDETFFVNLSAPTNATVTDAQGQGTITNDD
jgi:CSLREA domain-containing protein